MIGLWKAAPDILAPAVRAARTLSPARDTSIDVGSVTSYRTSDGEISHIRSRTWRTSSYGSGIPTTSERALQDSGSVYRGASIRRQCLPNNLPIFARRTRWRHGRTPKLRPTLCVYPCHRLLRVRRRWQAYVRQLRAKVAVVSLVYDKSVLRYQFGVHFIGIEEIDELRLCGRGFLGWDEPNFIRCRARCNLMR
jgi:hypothetical protein